MADKPPLDQAASNSLGLDLDALKLKDDPEPAASSSPSPSPAKDAIPDAAEDAPKSPEESAGVEGEGDDKETAGKKEPKEKKKPYVNPDRVRTGGAQRVCPPWHLGDASY